MASSSVVKRLKKMAAEIPDDKTVRHILQILEPEENAFADHSIALIGASVVDKALEVAIRLRLTPIRGDPEARGIFSYDRQGPLAEMSARIKMAHALNIVGPKTRNDLDDIRAIRNAFAHSVNLIRFDSPEVADICNGLHTPKTVTLLGQTAFGDTPRARYINATIAIAERLKRAIGKAQSETLMIAGRIFKARILP